MARDEVVASPGWNHATLGELGDWTSGGTPSRSHPEYYGEGIPWVKTGDLPDRPLYEVPESVTALGIKNSAAKRLPEGTLLVAMYGATIGKLGLLKVEAATNQACAALLPTGETAAFIPFVFQYLLAQREELSADWSGRSAAEHQPGDSEGLRDTAPTPPRTAPHRRQARSPPGPKPSRTRGAQRRAAAAREAASVSRGGLRGDVTKDWRAKRPDVEPASELLKRIPSRAEEEVGGGRAGQDDGEGEGAGG